MASLSLLTSFMSSLLATNGALNHDQVSIVRDDPLNPTPLTINLASNAISKTRSGPRRRSKSKSRWGETSQQEQPNKETRLTRPASTGSLKQDVALSPPPRRRRSTSCSNLQDLQHFVNSKRQQDNVLALDDEEENDESSSSNLGTPLPPIQRLTASGSTTTPQSSNDTDNRNFVWSTTGDSKTSDAIKRKPAWSPSPTSVAFSLQDHLQISNTTYSSSRRRQSRSSDRPLSRSLSSDHDIVAVAARTKFDAIVRTGGLSPPPGPPPLQSPETTRKSTSRVQLRPPRRRPSVDKSAAFLDRTLSQIDDLPSLSTTSQGKTNA